MTVKKAAYPTEPAYDMEYSSRKVKCPENLTLVEEVDVSRIILTQTTM